MVLASRLHGVDQEFVTAVEAKHQDLQKSSSGRNPGEADVLDCPRPGR